MYLHSIMADQDEGLISGLFTTNGSGGSEWCYDYNQCHFHYVSHLISVASLGTFYTVSSSMPTIHTRNRNHVRK